MGRFVGRAFRESFLHGAYLGGATLVGAHLANAILEDAHLEGVDLSNTLGLEGKQLDRAHGDATTMLPQGLPRPAHWTANK